MIDLYYSLIYPHLLYGILAWGGSSDIHLQPLLLLQKKIIRTITSSNYLDHTDPLFHRTKILKIPDIYLLQLGIYMFKLSRSEGITFPNHSYDTRHCNDALPTFQRLAACQRSLEFSGPQCWNSIPLPIKSCGSLNSFKRLYKMHLLSL